MKSNAIVSQNVADVCERLADGLDSFASAAAPLRRIAQLLRPGVERSKGVQRRVPPVPHPEAEPTELDRMRARKILPLKGFHVNPNGGKT